MTLRNLLNAKDVGRSRHIRHITWWQQHIIPSLLMLIYLSSHSIIGFDNDVLCTILCTFFKSKNLVFFNPIFQLWVYHIKISKLKDCVTYSAYW